MWCECVHSMTLTNIILKSSKGQGYIDSIIIVFIVILIIALATSVLPIFIKKAKLDTFADEVVRYAEIEGRIGTKTANKITQMAEQTGLNPTATWSTTGKIQLNNEFSLVLTLETDIGFFSVCEACCRVDGLKENLSPS